MRISAEKIQAKLQAAAGDGFPIVAWGYAYVGPSTYTVKLVALVVWLLGLGIALLTFHSWPLAAAATALGAAVYLALWSRVKFCLIGVSPRHFIAVDVTHRGQFLPPALQGLSSIQFPRLIDKELSTILHYVLGNGTLHYVRFQDFSHLPDNRDAARRIKQAVMELVYDPASVPVSQKRAG